MFETEGVPVRESAYQGWLDWVDRQDGWIGRDRTLLNSMDLI